jgi:hypothetical protein
VLAAYLPQADRMKNSRARLLVASWDETLLQSRTMMLGAYFSVQPAGRLSEAVQLVRKNPFDLLVLCHTLDNYQQETLAFIARQLHPSVEVLVLEKFSASATKPYANHSYEVGGGPWQLVAICAQIVGYKIRSKANHRAVAD